MAATPRYGNTFDLLRLQLSHTLRRLRSQPGYAFVHVLSLGTAVAASTIVFALLRTTVLDPLPYPDPDELVAIWESRDGEDVSVAWLNFQDWKGAVGAADLAAFSRTNLNLTGDGPAQRVRGLRMTDNLFQVLGVAPMMGRTPRVGEKATLLTHALWADRYGADQAILGRTVRLGGEAWTVVGVLPSGISFPDGVVLGASDLFVPLETDDLDYSNRGSHPGLTAIARLRGGVHMSVLRAELEAINEILVDRYPDTNGRSGIVSASAASVAAGDLEKPLFLLAGAVAFLLLAAVGNVSGLGLTRASANGPEWSLRATLGAGWAHVIRNAVVEGVLYGSMTTVVGLVAAWVAMARLPSWQPLSGYGLAGDLAPVDLALGGAVAFVGAALVGLVPLTGSMHALNRGMGGRTTARSRGREYLVSGQMALAMVLLVGASLMGRSLRHIEEFEGGLDPEGVTVFRVGLPESRYPDGDVTGLFYEELLSEIDALPGVVSTSGISTLPFSGSGAQSGMTPEGVADEQPVRTDVAVVFDGYFGTAGVEIVRGRSFGPDDDASMPTRVVVDERFAQRFWPGEDPIGKQVRGWGFQGAEVIGVSRHVKNYGVTRESRQELYVGHRQRPYLSMWVLVRVDPASTELTAPFRAVVTRLDPEVPIRTVSRMADVVDGTVSEVRVAIGLGSALTMFTVFLALPGLRSLVAYSVQLRTKEFGIRMAIGSERGRVRLSVLIQTLKLTAVGLVLGAVGATFTSQALESLIFGVDRLDAMSYGFAAAALMTIATLAGDGPARRAAAVDPQTALRGE